MTWSVEMILRASLVLASGLTVAAALRYRRAALRHTVLAGAIFGSTLVPVGALLPVVPVPLPATPMSIGAWASADTALGGTPERSSGHRERLTVEAAWTTLWFAGCVIVLAIFGADAIRLRRSASSAVTLHDARWRRCADDISMAMGIRTRVSLLLTNRNDVLATSGVVRPRILLPITAPSWSDERIRVVLYHELAHIRRRDWIVQVTAELVRAACWFNPLMWVACTRLRRESEHACDDVVVAAGVPPADYATHLVEIARSCRRPARLGSAMTMARPSTLHRRIAVMLNTQIDHRPFAPRRVAWIAALVFAAAVSVVALQAGQAGPAPLKGTVYDATGAVLPGAAITLRDVNGLEQTATSDPTGHFEFPAVPAGRYQLEMSLPGFRTLTKDLQLLSARDWDRVVTLQIGDLRETISVRASRTTPESAAPPQPSEPVRVGGNIDPPRKLVDVRPVYPPAMRSAGREGVVPLEAIIRRDGTVGSVRVLSAEIHPDFVIAAIDAVRQWRFSPTLLNGQPVEVVMNVSITFSLSN